MLVSRFPEPPGVEALRQIAAETLELPTGTPLARIYFSAGPYPSHWNRFRHVGPSAARWDHHLPNANDEPTEQDRAVLHCAPEVDTCAAEVFQATRRIDRIRNAPALTIFALQAPVTLLDVRGASPQGSALPPQFIPGRAPVRALGRVSCTMPIQMFRASNTAHR